MAEKRKDNKGRILAKGESQRKDGIYEYRFIDRDGRRKSVYASTLKELRDKEKEVTAGLVLGKQIKSTVTGVDLLNEALHRKELDVKANKLKLNSLKTYIAHYNTIVEDSIFKKKVTDVRAQNTIDWFESLADRGLTPASIRVKAVLAKAAFDIAVVEDIIQRNPFRVNGRTIANNSRKVVAISEQDQVRFCEFLISKRKFMYANIFTILVNTGLRLSELLALTVDDLDEEHMRLKVYKQVQYLNKRWCIVPPKSDCSVREIPLNSTAIEALNNAIAIRREGKSVVIDGYTDFIFVSHTGVLTQTSVDQFFREQCQKYNDKFSTDIRLTPHVLRHTYCTNLSSAGVHPRVLQYLMGHSSIIITEKIYDHADIDRAEQDLIRNGKIVRPEATTPFTTPFMRRDM